MLFFTEYLFEKYKIVILSCKYICMMQNNSHLDI